MRSQKMLSEKVTRSQPSFVLLSSSPSPSLPHTEDETDKGEREGEEEGGEREGPLAGGFTAEQEPQVGATAGQRGVCHAGKGS